MGYDLVLIGGRVIDPSQGIDKVTKVAFANGRVAAIGDDVETGGPRMSAMCPAILFPPA